MPKLILFLVILIASVWLGLAIEKHPGYLLIVYQPWLVQLPLWLAVLAALIFCLIFYLLISSIDSLHLLWYRFKNWLRFRREHVSYTKTQEALAAAIEGHWKQAEQLFVAGMSQTVEPLVNYLGAAKAAAAQKQDEKADQYLQKAYKISPHANIAIGIVQAEFALERDNLEQATATLNHLKQLDGKHPRVLQLLEKTYIRLADWPSLRALLPALSKSKLITKVQYVQFEKNIFCQLLNDDYVKDRRALDSLWYDVPRNIKKNPAVITAYVKQLLRFPNTVSEAEELIKKTLKTDYVAPLVALYGELPFDNLNRALGVAGNWLKQYGDKPDILLLLGKLCMRVQLWGKAKDYFERCLRLGPSTDASLAYGKLLEQLDENEEALRCYREGLTQQRIIVRNSGQ